METATASENVFQGRSFLACKDFTPAEIMYLVDFALHLKRLKKDHIPHRYLEGKNIVLLFIVLYRSKISRAYLFQASGQGYRYMMDK